MPCRHPVPADVRGWPLTERGVIRRRVRRAAEQPAAEGSAAHPRQVGGRDATARPVRRVAAPAGRAAHGALRVVRRQRRARQPRGDLPAPARPSRTWPHLRRTSGRSRTSRRTRRSVAEFAGDPRVRFVEDRSPRTTSRRWPTAKYLVNNATFPQRVRQAARAGLPQHLARHPAEAHGLSTCPAAAPDSRNIIRNFLKADYLLSANPFMTEHDVPTAPTGCRSIFRGAVIEEGHPRTDRSARGADDPAAARGLLESRGGIAVGDREVVLYAPTWRGESFYDPRVNAAQLLATVRDAAGAARPADATSCCSRCTRSVYDAVARARRGCDVPGAQQRPDQPGPRRHRRAGHRLLQHLLRLPAPPAGRSLHFVPDLDDYRPSRGLYLARRTSCPGRCCTARAGRARQSRLRRRWPDPLVRRRAVCEAAAYAATTTAASARGSSTSCCAAATSPAYRVRRDFGTEKATLLVYLGRHEVARASPPRRSTCCGNLDYDALRRHRVLPFTAADGTGLKNIELDRPAGAGRARVAGLGRVEAAGPRAQAKHLMVTGMPKELDAQHRRFWATSGSACSVPRSSTTSSTSAATAASTPFLFSVRRGEVEVASGCTTTCTPTCSARHRRDVTSRTG